MIPEFKLQELKSSIMRQRTKGLGRYLSNLGNIIIPDYPAPPLQSLLNYVPGRSLFFTNNKVFYGIDKLPLTIGSYGLLLEIEFTKAFGRIVTQSNIAKASKNREMQYLGKTKNLSTNTDRIKINLNYLKESDPTVVQGLLKVFTKPVGNVSYPIVLNRDDVKSATLRIAFRKTDDS
jgi:hypothetical protein